MIAFILTTHTLLGAMARYQPIIPLKTCGSFMALIGSYFLVVPTFPRPLSSQEIDVGISIRTEEVESRNDCSAKTSSI